ncbi:LPxTG domain-containing protein [Corynebacterium kutscheri]|uniref:DUF5979 domain-containing protein n=1 Tax=Corynebacterium kutscheri TaxID=35755 RepID=UPI000F6B53A5|nr:DUF5979 domain-containing protein [Corynebacterium kutscheri]VEH80205.1 LPxTG domain-containing protein [Corynebacterium kutscheri]
MNHSYKKGAITKGFPHSPWIAALFTLVLIASFIPFAVQFSTSAQAQENAVSETKEGRFRIVKYSAGVKDDKSLDYDQKFTNRESKFTWECSSPEGKGNKKASDLKGDFTVNSAGGSFVSDYFPLGTKCSVTEDTTAAKIDGYTHKLVVEGQGVTQDGNTLSFTIESAQMASITVHNRYTPGEEAKPEPKPNPNPAPKPDPQPQPKPEDKQGSFRISKSAVIVKSDGSFQYDDAKFTQRDFKFTWECTPPKGKKETGELTVKATAAIPSKKFPLGTTCTVAEDAASAKFDGYTHKLAVDSKHAKQDGNKFTFTIDSETVSTIDVRNEYILGNAPIPPTSSSKTTTPTASSTTKTTPSASSTATSTASSTSKPTTEPTESTTTRNFPPIIPIPIPIPVPPAPFPPAPQPTPAPHPAPAPGNNSNPAAPHHGGNNVAQPQQSNNKNTATAPSQSNKGQGKLANTGASVIWLALVALLLAVVGSFITYRGRLNKNN